MASIVVFAAHNDDHALAMGGTLALHYKRGDQVTTFVGSFGELSHPHLRPEVIRKTRVREAQKADRTLGGDGRVFFLGLRELKFREDFERKGYPKKLARRLRELKPDRVFVPTPDDTHPDHKAISTLVLAMLERSRLRSEVYGYRVYPRFSTIEAPRLIVDVSAAYRKKLDALSAYRSQIRFFSYAFTNNIVFVYHLVRDLFAGFLKGTRFAETFYKLR